MTLLLCPNVDCSVDLLPDMRSVTPGYTPEPHDIVICGTCGAIGAVNADGETTRPMSPGEVAALPVDLQKDVDFAVRNIVNHIHSKQHKR
jgi:hypothetical protein